MIAYIDSRHFFWNSNFLKYYFYGRLQAIIVIAQYYGICGVSRETYKHCWKDSVCMLSRGFGKIGFIEQI
jgi:hypothetical protein